MTGYDRFWSKVDAAGPCWEWTSAKTPAGYGAFRHEGKTVYAHRLAYELLVGPIPEGLQLDHLCRVRHCVNPDHLEPVTGAENTRRGHPYVPAPKASCDHGHDLSGENLYVCSKGHRRCKACRRENVRRWKARQAA